MKLLSLLITCMELVYVYLSKVNPFIQYTCEGTEQIAFFYFTNKEYLLDHFNSA